jgi:predicted restriction endonuclease
MNGLLLTPDADLLFDRGFITFNEDADVIVSARVNKYDLRRLGFEQLATEYLGFNEAETGWKRDIFLPDQHRYLAYHRSEIFIN